MARDAESAGDRVAWEGYLQYAEHYLRVLSAAEEGRNDGRAQENGKNVIPNGGQQAVLNANSSNAGGGRGNGKSQPESTLGDAGGPVPEMLKDPAKSSRDTDQPLDDMDKDPIEIKSAVN